MFIIAGLGNPTREYEGTRHNVGFDVIDRLAARYNIDVDVKKHRALIGKGMDRRAESDSCKATDVYESERREYPQYPGLL